MMIISSPDPLPENVVQTVRRWEQREHSRLFGLIVSGLPPTVGEINRGLVRKVRDECRTLEKCDVLDVILDSGGGSADAAYKLVTFLRSRCSKLRVFVPDWAKSAATLFCLGADEIWMSETAELGPLDAQIQDPRNPQEAPVSALEQFRAMNYLKRYSFEMLDTYVRLLIDQVSPMRLRDMIEQATPFVTRFMSPLYQQVDPWHLGGSARALDVAVEYGKRLIRRYAYADWDRETGGKLVDSLTWDYPSHSFVIDRDEAKELGLHVCALEGERERDAQAVVGDMRVWVGFLENEPESPPQNKNGTRKRGKNNEKQTEQTGK